MTRQQPPLLRPPQLGAREGGLFLRLGGRVPFGVGCAEQRPACGRRGWCPGPQGLGTQGAVAQGGQQSGGARDPAGPGEPAARFEHGHAHAGALLDPLGEAGALGARVQVTGSQELVESSPFDAHAGAEREAGDRGGLGRERAHDIPHAVLETVVCAVREHLPELLARDPASTRLVWSRLALKARDSGAAGAARRRIEGGRACGRAPAAGSRRGPRGARGGRHPSERGSGIPCVATHLGFRCGGCGLALPRAREPHF